MADKETVIGPETRISGDIRGEEDVVVRGRLEGKVQLSQTLTVDEGGIVQADVEVKVLIVSGVVVGAIHASELVRLTDKARVIGDISTPRFVMEAGAAYRGRLEMGDIDAARAGEKRASAKRETPRAAAAPARPTVTAPPRIVPPAAVTTSAIRAPSPPSAPPRVTSAPPRSAPIMPRPAEASVASAAPAWAKKKLRRR
jgi:cytoskeletal protein CcmA (bactofilin family)